MANKLLTASSLLAAMLASAWPASAASFEPAPNLGGMIIDLDTAAGNFSVWSLTDLTGLDTIQATVSMNRLGEDPRWAPGAQIVVEDEAHSVRFQILSPTRQAPILLKVTRTTGGKTEQEMPFKTTLGIGEKIDVVVRWTQAGDVTVALSNGEEVTAQLEGAPTTVEIIGSTSETEFNPLSVGRTKP